MITRQVLSKEIIRSSLPTRWDEGNKFDFGRLLIVAGCAHYTGAAVLATQAALRVGVGLVHVAIPASMYAPMAASVLEAIWELLPETGGALNGAAVEAVTAILPKFDAMLVGPGIGQLPGTKDFISGFFETGGSEGGGTPRMVLDADGLRLAASISGWLECMPVGSVITPHEGEMAGITGLSLEDVRARRGEIAAEYAMRWGLTVVLKGANTLIARPDGELYINQFSSSALAHGGTGDVLAGMVAGFMAQGLGGFEAACCGVWLHSRCAELATASVGHPASLLPSDLVGVIGKALSELVS